MPLLVWGHGSGLSAFSFFLFVWCRPDAVLTLCVCGCVFVYAVVLQAQQIFLKDATPRERDLIKAMPDTEMVMQMLGNCRISSAGAAGKGGKKK